MWQKIAHLGSVGTPGGLRFNSTHEQKKKTKTKQTGRVHADPSHDIKLRIHTFP